jgi:DNA-binding transcriptional regulator YdaS (Cro superfamily)
MTRFKKQGSTAVTQQTIQTAIDKAGGMRALARAIGVSYQAIQSWKTRIPAERVLAVEQATGISRELLRPDLYGKKSRQQ